MLVKKFFSFLLVTVYLVLCTTGYALMVLVLAPFLLLNSRLNERNVSVDKTAMLISGSIPEAIF